MNKVLVGRCKGTKDAPKESVSTKVLKNTIINVQEALSASEVSPQVIISPPLTLCFLLLPWCSLSHLHPRIDLVQVFSLVLPSPSFSLVLPLVPSACSPPSMKVLAKFPSYFTPTSPPTKACYLFRSRQKSSEGASQGGLA
jgi:hypothetical protein